MEGDLAGEVADGRAGDIVGAGLFKLIREIEAILFLDEVRRAPAASEDHSPRAFLLQTYGRRIDPGGPERLRGRCNGQRRGARHTLERFRLEVVRGLKPLDLAGYLTREVFGIEEGDRIDSADPVPRGLPEFLYPDAIGAHHADPANHDSPPRGSFAVSVHLDTEIKK